MRNLWRLMARIGASGWFFALASAWGAVQAMLTGSAPMCVAAMASAVVFLAHASESLMATRSQFPDPEG